MQKPKGFDAVAASLMYEPLELGGHVCIIKNAEEDVSKTGRPMLKVAIDIATGDPQAGYFAARFANDTRENRRWPCVAYVVTVDDKGDCSRSLAGFVTSVEESNPGFQFPWDNVVFLKGKRIGGVFGQEEYMAKDGKIKKATKLFWFRSADKVKDAPVPDVKKYKPQPTRDPGWASISNDDIPF